MELLDTRAIGLLKPVALKLLVHQKIVQLVSFLTDQGTTSLLVVTSTHIVTQFTEPVSQRGGRGSGEGGEEGG